MTTEATNDTTDPARLFALDGIVREAIAASGVDLTIEQFIVEEPRIEILRLLLEQAKSTPGGIVDPTLQRIGFVQQIQERIRLRAAKRAEPERFQRPLQRPLFVTGLMRTGTTVLYHLLANQKGVRAPRLWELWKPVPYATSPNDADPRIMMGEMRCAFMLGLLPEMRYVHDLVAQAPEECTFLMMEDFCTDSWKLTNENPPYTEWFDRQNFRDFYGYHRDVISYLDSFDSPASHWVLKSPYHLFHLPGLFAIYPDANVVFSHRNPIEVVASTISLLTIAQRKFIPDFDPRPTARHVLDEFAKGLRAMDQARSTLAQSGNGSQLFDVAYRDLMADPVSTIKSIYVKFDYGWSDSGEEDIAKYLAENPKNKSGVHKYSLEQFGLTASDVNTALADYIEAYGHFWR